MYLLRAGQFTSSAQLFKPHYFRVPLPYQRNLPHLKELKTLHVDLLQLLKTAKHLASQTKHTSTEVENQI